MYVYVEKCRVFVDGRAYTVMFTLTTDYIGGGCGFCTALGERTNVTIYDIELETGAKFNGQREVPFHTQNRVSELLTPRFYFHGRAYNVCGQTRCLDAMARRVNLPGQIEWNPSWAKKSETQPAQELSAKRNRRLPRGMRIHRRRMLALTRRNRRAS